MKIYRPPGLRVGEPSFVVVDLKATGSTLTNGTGTFTGSPKTLLPGNNTVACTGAGTATIVLPAGSTGTATTDTMTVTDSPKALVGGSNTIATTGGTGNITVAVNAISFALPNPRGYDLLISRIVVEVTTPGGTATSVLQVGESADIIGSALNSMFFTGLDLNSAYVYDSFLAADSGAQTKYIIWPSPTHVCGKINTAIANALAGRVYIYYVKR